MDIDEAKYIIYWMVVNCVETDCDGLMDCETCEYNVPYEKIDEAEALLTSAGLIGEIDEEE